MIGEIIGHYRIVAKIGEGGMGVVYRAHDEVLQRDVALKLVSQGAAAEKLSREHLLREARAASALSHPNICTIHEVGEFGDELYMIMELVDGKSLRELIWRDRLAMEAVLRYGVQIAAALAHAHGRNVIHHDLKSANVVVTPEGLAKVLDFGLARGLPKLPADEATMSMAPEKGGGTVSGTLAYMAPEVLRGQAGDQRADLWALGIVLYEAAAGQLPFRGATGVEIGSAILHETPPPLPERIPPGLRAIVQRCLAKEPAQRYQQAAEVQAALEAVQSSVTVPAQPEGPRGPLTTMHRGSRHLRVRDGDVLLMVGTVKGAFLLRSNAERRRWDIAGPYFH